MKNSRKRKFISQDVTYFKTKESLKKVKVDGMTCECQSPVDWYEVKIILDATVVKKYLNNKKFNSRTLTSPIDNISTTCREENLVSNAPPINKTLSSVFSKVNDVMVKLETLEDIRCDNLAQKENFEFINEPVKQEEYIINSDEFQESMYQYQNDKNHVSLSEKVVEEMFKNEVTVSDRYHEELTIGSEFKHEEFIPNYENPELISLENVDARRETLPRRITRSNRQKKKCRDCDANCNHQVVKKLQISLRVDKKPIKDLNCGNKSKKKKTSQPSLLLEPPANPRPRRRIKKSYCCDNCGRTYLDRKAFSRHFKNVHLRSSLNDLITCTKCKSNVKSRNLKRHQFCCSLAPFFKCKYCLVPIKSKMEMRKHLETAHIDIFPQGIIKQSTLDEFWIQSMKEVVCELERAGDTKRLAYFASNFLRVKDYWTPTSSDEPCQKFYNCKLCGYKWTRKSQLYKHIFKHMDEKKSYLTCCKCCREFRSNFGKERFKWHEEFCGISIIYSCIFCPKRIKSLNELAKHFSKHYEEEPDDMNTEDILKYIATFKKMIQAINKARFDEKMKREKVAGEMIDDANYYLAGIQSILKPVCLKCNATIVHSYEICLECAATLFYHCVQCDKQFSNYFTGWKHVTGTCENRILTLPVTSNKEKGQLHADNHRQFDEPSHLVDHSYALHDSDCC